ncbi:MAG: SRPBCC family protein [Kofleriaceae bacterium]
MTVHFEYAIEIPRQPAQVFAVLDDVARTPEWFSRCTAAEKLEPGANAVGSPLRYAILQRGTMTGTMEGSVVAYARDAHIAFRLTDRMFDITIDFQLAPIASGSRVVHQIDIVPRSLVARLLQPLLRRVIPNQVAIDMAKLRDLV